jgi:hypothetical protein
MSGGSGGGLQKLPRGFNRGYSHFRDVQRNLGPEQAAKYTQSIQDIYNRQGMEAPAWTDPVGSMSTQQKMDEFKHLGRDAYQGKDSIAARSKHIQDTLGNIKSQGLTHTPEYMYDAMRRGELDASTEAQLKMNYFNSPEYQANYKKMQDLWRQYGGT